MQERAVKIGHGRKALGTLRGTFLPADIFTDIRQGLVPGILPGNVAQARKIRRGSFAILAVEIAPAHVALACADPDLADEHILCEGHLLA